MTSEGNGNYVLFGLLSCCRGGFIEKYVGKAIRYQASEAALTGPKFLWLYWVVGPHFIYCYRAVQHTWFAKVSGGRRSACESDLKDTHSALWMVKNNECKVNSCLFTRKLPSAPLTLGGRSISCGCGAAITIFTFMTEKTTSPQHSDSVDVFPHHYILNLSLFCEQWSLYIGHGNI